MTSTTPGMARTGQVVYLTHHRHLCDLAKQVAPDVRIPDDVRDPVAYAAGWLAAPTF